MAQRGIHFRLSAAARTLDFSAISRMSDEQAHQKFMEMRWPETGGKPVCPHCAYQEKIYIFKNGRTFKCARCRKKFSVTSGTIFHSRKKPIRVYLEAIAKFVNAAKGISAIQLSLDLKVAYETAFVIEHKLREVMGLDVQAVKQLEGEGEIDGTFFTRFERKKNTKIERRDRRRAPNRVVAVARERWGRTLAWVVNRETDAKPIYQHRIEEGTILYADSASWWDLLAVYFPLMFRVVHDDEYVSIDGASVNWCESFNSRIHKIEYGTHHHIAGCYLQSYANEAVWREDYRRDHNDFLWRSLIRGALNSPKSKLWCGYWQRGRGDIATIPGIRG